MKQIKYPLLKFILVGLLAWFLVLSVFAIQSLFEIRYEENLQKVLGVINPARDKISAPGPITRFIARLYSPFIEAPALYLGLQKPPEDFTSATYRRQYFYFTRSHQNQMVIPAQADIADESPLDIFGANAQFYTTSPLVIAHYKSSLPHITQLGNKDDLIKTLVGNMHSVGILSQTELTPIVDVVLQPFLVNLWIGWKENTHPLWSKMAINSKLLEAVDQLMAEAQRTDQPKPNVVHIIGDFPGDIIKNDDLTIASLNSPLSRDQLTRAKKLKELGIDVLNCANEKIIQGGMKKLETTFHVLRKAELPYVGAGFNFQEAALGKIISLSDGTRVGLIAFSNIVPLGASPTIKQAGINPYHPETSIEKIKELKQACDIVIVQMRWNKMFEDISQMLINAGADVVVGSAPDQKPKLTWVGDKPVIFNLGNETLRLEIFYHKLAQVKL